MEKTTLIRPRVSEKAYGLSQTRNVYVFEVPTDANKQLIAEAVAVQYGVTVEGINIMNVKGKVKRTVRRGGRAAFGKRKDIKKAYVTLKEGDSITIFPADDETAEPKTTAPRQTRTKKEAK
jgi:large subunit ribosomal protein L23